MNFPIVAMAGKVIPIITARESKLLWDNARDSIRHALQHFDNLSLKNGDEDHNKKWIVLSVHHAAEAFCNMLLKQFDPSNPAFKRNGKDWYPSLAPAIEGLLQPRNRVRLTDSEARLLDILRELNDARNKIMHRLVPENIDVSLAAIAILGLSRVAHRRRGEHVDDILQGDPPIQTSVIDAINYSKLEDYYRFIERFLGEEFPGEYLSECENCGASAVLNRRCEACFHPAA